MSRKVTAILDLITLGGRRVVFSEFMFFSFFSPREGNIVVKRNFFASHSLPKQRDYYSKWPIVFHESRDGSIKIIARKYDKKTD